MPAAKGPPIHSPIRSSVEKLLRKLFYYTALIACVILTIAVSYSVILHLARDSVRDEPSNPEAVAEVRSLRDFERELREISAALERIAKQDEALTEAFSRRLNDLRRRMHQFPKDSDALSALIQCGDRLLAWTATPTDEAARSRAAESLVRARAAVKERVTTLNVPDSMTR